MEQRTFDEAIRVLKGLIDSDVIIWSAQKPFYSTNPVPGRFSDWPLLTEAATMKTPCGILSPKQHPLCAGCPNRERCRLKSEFVFPFDNSPSQSDEQTYVQIVITCSEEPVSIDSNDLYPLLENFARYIHLLIKWEHNYSQLAVAQEQLSYLLNLLPEGAIVLDRSKTVVATNRNALELELADNLQPDRQLAGLLRSVGNLTEATANCPTPTKNLLVREHSFYRNKDFAGAIVHTLNLDYGKKDLALTAINKKTLTSLIGKDPSLLKVIGLIRQAARTDSTILLRGESGTGKEIFARTVHELSPRAHGHFIAINCAAIPEQLLESELFGYEEGSFTGARKGGKLGQIESANRGTLFLDEIGDMPPALQAKLLRVIQSKQIQRLGGNLSVPVDVRFVAATHRNLEEMIHQGSFREDLYFRLSVIPAYIPPLRERKGDIELLLNYYLTKYCLRFQKSFKIFSYEARQQLVNYSWPGNIRELENVVEYLVNIHDQDIITPEQLPLNFSSSLPSSWQTQAPGNHHSQPSAHEENRQAELVEKLDRFGWDVPGKQQAAKALGISLATLYRLLAKNKIKRRG